MDFALSKKDTTSSQNDTTCPKMTQLLNSENDTTYCPKMTQPPV